MSWIILFFAGLFEVGWAVGLKYTDGFSRPLPTALTVAAMAISLGLLGLAMKELPLGTAYAIWTGVGAVGTVIAGIILFGESMALIRLASVALIVTGLIGLKASTANDYLTVPRNSPTNACSSAGCAASTATGEPATSVTRDHKRRNTPLFGSRLKKLPHNPCNASGITGTGVSSRIRVSPPLNSLISPSAVNLPSGKMHTNSPSFRY